MSNLSISTVLIFAASVVFQLFGLVMLPLTKGFTEPVPTIGAAVGFLLGIGLLARLINSGANLSMLIPLLAAIVPLVTIAFGFLVYGELASTLKVVLLVSACILIGVASAV